MTTTFKNNFGQEITIAQNVIDSVDSLKSLGIKWVKNRVGITYDGNKQWSVNAIVLNDDGSTKPVHGLLTFDNADDAIDAENIMRR